MEELQHPPGGNVDDNLILRIAQLTRMLRESMRELGLDQAVKDAAHAIPDARDRLHYVARMTEQAANRVLNAAESLQPVQDELQNRAAALDQRWQAWFDQPVELSEARELVDDTRAMLNEHIPAATKTTQDVLLDIIMAQDFQDLTGQVIMKMLNVVTAIETELVQVLVDSVPHERREEANSLLNGPAVNPGKPDIVTSQDQVDDLLDSLGF